MPSFTSRHAFLVLPPVLVLVVLCGASARAQPILSMDVDDRTDASVTETGFERFQLDNPLVGNTTMRTFNALSVTVSSVGTNLDDRGRQNLNNSGEFTQQSLLRDFVFATYNANDLTSGMDVRIAGLTAGAPYEVKVWSYDIGSTGNRISDWFVNGSATPSVDNYTFNGSNLPTSNTQYTFTLSGTADPSGALLLSGRRDAVTTGDNTPAVFVNALQVTLVPEPSGAAIVTGGLVLLARVRRGRKT